MSKKTFIIFFCILVSVLSGFYYLIIKNRQSNIGNDTKEAGLVESLNKYGHFVFPDYMPKASKGLPRYSQLDPLGEGGFDSTYNFKNIGGKTLTIAKNIDEEDFNSLVKNKPPIIQATYIDKNYKSKINLGVNISNFTVSEFNEILASNGVKSKAHFVKTVNNEYYDNFLDTLVYQRSIVSTRTGKKEFIDSYASIQLSINGLPLIVPKAYGVVPFMGNIEKSNGEYTFEYFNPVKISDIQTSVPIKTYEQLIQTLEKNNYVPFWVRSDWGNIYEGQIWHEVEFTKLGMLYVIQSKAILPYFYVCGTGDAKSDTAGYFCALTEAVDYGD